MRAYVVYIVVMADKLCPVSNAAKASKLVSALTISRAKAKRSVIAELIACPTAQADVNPASRTNHRKEVV